MIDFKSARFFENQLIQLDSNLKLIWVLLSKSVNSDYFVIFKYQFDTINYVITSDFVMHTNFFFDYILKICFLLLFHHLWFQHLNYIILISSFFFHFKIWVLIFTDLFELVLKFLNDLNWLRIVSNSVFFRIILNKL